MKVQRVGRSTHNSPPQGDAVAGHERPTAEIVYTRRFLRRRPLLRLNEDGLEWAAGRIRWADVTLMELFEAEGVYSYASQDTSGSWHKKWVALSLRPSAELLPAMSRDYTRATDAWTWGKEPTWDWEGRLLLTLSSGSEPLSTETIRRFYHGPIVDRGWIRGEDLLASWALFKLHQSRRRRP